jgi:ABC-2 type transport system permease protein
VLIVSLGVASLGVGIGALFPRFSVDNPAKIPTGVGGVTFMIISFAFVIGLLLASFYPTFVLQELPRRLTRAPVARVRWFVSSLVATGVLSLLGTFLPMWLGRLMLSRRED